MTTSERALVPTPVTSSCLIEALNQRHSPQARRASKSLPHARPHQAAMSTYEPVFDSIFDTIAAFAAGEFVIVLDSPSRENEGDLIIAAQDLTTEKASFMIRYTSGYLCAPLTVSRAASLELPQMVRDNKDPNRTAYTVTVDAASPHITTGISAHDRALTCRTLADSSATAESFRRPGHIVPLQARAGGVLARRGHTEAAVELCRLAGKRLVGVIGELVTDGEEVHGTTDLVGGGMMRRNECLAFGKRWGLRVCTIEDLVKFVEAERGAKEDDIMVTPEL